MGTNLLNQVSGSKQAFKLSSFVFNRLGVFKNVIIPKRKNYTLYIWI